MSALTQSTREKVDLIEAESQEEAEMTMENTVVASEKPVPSAAEFCSTAQKAKRNIEDVASKRNIEDIALSAAYNWCHSRKPNAAPGDVDHDKHSAV